MLVNVREKGFTQRNPATPLIKKASVLLFYSDNSLTIKGFF